MTEHSIIGASSASRWFNCPGSIRLIDQAPPQEPSKYAAEGTAAHTLAETCLNDQNPPEDYIGEIIDAQGFEFEVDQEMCDAVKVYLDEVNSEMGQWVVLTEIKVDLTRLYPDLFGTADAIKIDFKNRILQIIDYKHGKGVVVEVENNKQEMYYVLGAIEWVFKEYGKSYQMDDPTIFGWMSWFKEIHMIVVQPRARHIDGPVRRWTIPDGVLDQFEIDLVAAAKATKDKNAPLVAGGHCRFCPAIAICPAQLQLITDTACADFKPIVKKEAPVMPVVEKLTMDQLTGVLMYADQISSWLKSVEAYAYALLSRGESVPGYKLVKKKSNRKWINEEEAISELSLYLMDEDYLTPQELKSPAQVEKALKKKEKDLIKKYIEQPDTGNTIAEDSDPRDAISGGSVMSDFKALN